MNINRLRQPSTVLVCSLLSFTAVSHAQRVPAAGSEASIQQLRQQLDDQARQIETLRQAVAEQDARQRELQRLLEPQAHPVASQPAPQPTTASPTPDTDRRAVQVGSAPPQEFQPPVVAPLFDQQGILTPKGKFVLEPSLQYGYSSSNRVALVGYTIIPALLIGLVDVREVKRNRPTRISSSRSSS